MKSVLATTPDKLILLKSKQVSLLPAYAKALVPILVTPDGIVQLVKDVL